MISDDQITLKILPSCCTFLMLTTWEILVEYRLITCLPRAFPVFSPFSLSSRCLYSVYVSLRLSSFTLSTLSYPNVFYCQGPFLCLLHPLNILVFKVVQCPLLVYQQYLQKTHYRLLYFLNLSSSLWHVKVGTIWQTIWRIRAMSMPAEDFPPWRKFSISSKLFPG